MAHTSEALLALEEEEELDEKREWKPPSATPGLLARSASQKPTHPFFSMQTIKELGDVHTDTFNMMVGLVIVMNAGVIGLETDLPPCLFFTIMEHSFNTFFVSEMIMRLWQLRLEYFQSGWSWFDASLVISGTIDLWVLPLVSGGKKKKGGIVSLMRLLRILRILRVLRIFRMFRDLMLIAKAFGNALQSVCWIGSMVLILDYICAVFLTQVLGHNSEQWAEEIEQANIDDWFGSILSSMYTLFLIMTLAEWDIICATTMNQYPLMVIFFIFYIILSSYTMVSLITGVISESLLSAQREDEINKLKAIESGRQELKSSLQAIFEEVDADGTGSVSKDEIENVILHQPKIVAKLESLDIDCDGEELMEVFDAIHATLKSDGTSAIDGEEVIPIHEFVSAMANIRGTASQKELFLLREQIKALKLNAGVQHTELSRLIQVGNGPVSTPKKSGSNDMLPLLPEQMQAITKIIQDRDRSQSIAIINKTHEGNGSVASQEVQDELKALRGIHEEVLKQVQQQREVLNQLKKSQAEHGSQGPVTTASTDALSERLQNLEKAAKSDIHDCKSQVEKMKSVFEQQSLLQERLVKAKKALKEEHEARIKYEKQVDTYHNRHRPGLVNLVKALDVAFQGNPISASTGSSGQDEAEINNVAKNVRTLFLRSSPKSEEVGPAHHRVSFTDNPDVVEVMSLI